MYLWDPFSPNNFDKLTGLRTGLCAVVVMSPQPSANSGSLAVTLSVDGCVCVWSVRHKTILTCTPACVRTPTQLLTCSPAVTQPAAHGARVFSHIMTTAQSSRIILASNRIFLLAPISGTAPAQAPNVCMLLSEKNGSCVGVTNDGVLYELQPAHDCSSNINFHKHSTSSFTSHFSDSQTSLGRRCTPAAAHDGPHTMCATAACLLHDAAVTANERISQLSSSNQVAVLFFSPPPISPTAPIDLRLTERDAVSVTQRQQSQGCLQAHSVADGRLLHVFEGCSDDISCLAVSCGDKTTSRFLLAGSDQEGGGASLMLWTLSRPGETLAQAERLVPLLITIKVDRVYPSCGAVTAIVGRATDAIIAFVGGKIAIFSLVSKSFKCVSL